MTSSPPPPDAKQRVARVFLDTEFADNAQKTAVLLSIALLSSTGEELYLELPASELAKLPKRSLNQFVRKVVLPQFCLVADGAVPRTEMADRLFMWLARLGAAEVEVVYDYSGDFGFIEQLQQETKVQPIPALRPAHVAYLLEDLAGRDAAFNAEQVMERTRGLRSHHALADTYILRARFEAVHGRD